MFPEMVKNEILAIKPHKKAALGWKLSGAGSAGDLVIVSNQSIPGFAGIKIRRNDFGNGHATESASVPVRAPYFNCTKPLHAGSL
jgi:hypothetical protein